MAEIYHRLATGQPNQNLLVAFKQAQSREVWGGVSTYGSLFPTVRAFRGPLPSGAEGVEFETDVPPSPGSSTPREVYWKLCKDSPLVKAAAGGTYAAIPVVLRRVRYTQNSNLKDGVDWP